MKPCKHVISPYQNKQKMELLWGIDLGGTKIEGIILEDRKQPNVLKRLRIPTEAKKGYHHIIGQIGKLVEVMIAETGLKPAKIGMGTPGTLDPITQTMKNCNTKALNDRCLKKDVEKLLNIPFEIANDANCFAIAETNMGIVKDIMPEAKVVFGVIMGTGVGGGLVVNQQVINGRQGIAGEWGHNFLDESGGACYCGKSGCVEGILSGPALEHYYKNLTGVRRRLKTIVARYHNGNDPAATETIERLLYYFGLAISNVINIIDPEVIILGGGLGNIDLLYTKGVKAIEPHIFNTRVDTLFLKPKLGDSAGVFGAAFL